MINGYTTFICDECQHKFRGISIQFSENQTILIQPVRCPMCGSLHTYPESASKHEYAALWLQKDKEDFDY